MTGQQYILDGRKVIQVDDDSLWLAWRRNADRRVAFTKTANGDVSTVFLGMDHQLGYGPPLVFETLVTGGVFDGDVWHSATWKEALEDHKAAVEFVTNRKEET